MWIFCARQRANLTMTGRCLFNDLVRMMRIKCFSIYALIFSKNQFSFFQNMKSLEANVTSCSVVNTVCSLFLMKAEFPKGWVFKNLFLSSVALTRKRSALWLTCWRKMAILHFTLTLVLMKRWCFLLYWLDVSSIDIFHDKPLGNSS